MITATLVFFIASAYAMAPNLDGGITPVTHAADLARSMGPLIAGLAALSAFPSTQILRCVNVVLGIALALSPLAFPSWSATALVIQVIVGLWVTGFSLLPRSRECAKVGGGWKHVLSSPSTIDRIETAAEL